MKHKPGVRPLEHEIERAELESQLAALAAELAWSQASPAVIDLLDQTSLRCIRLSTPAERQRATMQAIGDGLRAGILKESRRLGCA